MKKTILSWSLLFACNLMWSLQYTCVKLTQDQMGPFFTVWGPMGLATLMLAPFALREFRRGGKKFKDILIFVQLALLGAFPAQVLITRGTQLSMASNAAILTLIMPITTAILAFILLREKMNRARWFSFIIAICGVILISTGDIQQLNFSSKYALGNILVFMGILGSSYYNVGIKKIADRYTEMEMVFYTYVVVVVLLTPLIFVYEGDVFGRVPAFTGQTWIGFILLTFFHNFLSMVLFFKALKILDAIQVALSNYLIAFFGVPIAAIWLRESLSTQSIIGGLLVFSSTLIITIVDYRLSHKKDVK